MDLDEFGALFGTHIKAYIHTEIKKISTIDNLLAINDASIPVEDTALSSPLPSSRFYFDPFYINNEPLSLSLPDLLTQLSALFERYPDSNIDILYVSASSWELFYRRLLKASTTVPEFLETSLNVQQRFAFNLDPDPSYQHQAFKMLAGTERDFAQLEQLATRYDQVYSAALILQYDTQ